MAQTNFTPILLYSSSTPTNAPSAGNLTNSVNGSEIAINIADKNLFFKDSGGVVNTVPIRQSNTSSNGWLSSTDWNTFNSKQAALVSGTNIKTVGGVSLLGSGDVGTIGVGYGGTGLTAVTAGYILFGSNSTTLGTSSNLFWDNANGRLGINKSSPASAIDIVGYGQSNTSWVVTKDGSDSIGSGPLFQIQNLAGTRSWVTQLGASNTYDWWSFNGSAWSKFVSFFQSGGVSIGNTTDPGAGNLSVTGTIKGSTYYTTTGQTASTASGSAVTLFSITGDTVYIVNAAVTGTSAPASYTAVAIVKSSGSTLAVTNLSTASNLTITVSGTNIQATQTSGVAQIIVYSAIKIF